MNTKPTITEALLFAKANRFKAPSIFSRKELYSYICKNIRPIARQTLSAHIKACIANIQYDGVIDRRINTLYTSEIVSDIYNINKFFKEGREIYKTV